MDMRHRRHPILRLTFSAFTALIAVSLLGYLGIILVIIAGIGLLVAVGRQIRSMR